MGQAITLIMKGIHSTARPTVSLSDVVADSCLNLIGPCARLSVRGFYSSFLSLSLSHAIPFTISYNRPGRGRTTGPPLFRIRFSARRHDPARGTRGVHLARASEVLASSPPLPSPLAMISLSGTGTINSLENASRRIGDRSAVVILCLFSPEIDVAAYATVIFRGPGPPALPHSPAPPPPVPTAPIQDGSYTEWFEIN